MILLDVLDLPNILSLIQLTEKFTGNFHFIRLKRPRPLVFQTALHCPQSRTYDKTILSFRLCNARNTFAINLDGMDTIKGTDAIHKAELVSKSGGDFSMAFFPFSRKKPSKGKVGLKVSEGCTCRLPLPRDRFDIDSRHFFLFSDRELNPKMCYKILIRYIGFPEDGYKLKKVIWYE